MQFAFPLVVGYNQGGSAKEGLKLSWIRVVEAGEADEKLRNAYETVGAARGEVANILKLHSLRPEAMIAHLNLYRELMFSRSELTRRERETIAVAVSVVNECHY